MNYLWVILVALLVGAPASRADSSRESKPNIVFIFTNDQPQDAMSCLDNRQVRTPSINVLAATGLRFTHGFASPLCGPSRTMLNTGRYHFRNGAMSNTSPHIPSAKEEPSFARTLTQAGYAADVARSPVEV